jgi:hypothetical protein
MLGTMDLGGQHLRHPRHALRRDARVRVEEQHERRRAGLGAAVAPVAEAAVALGGDHPHREAGDRRGRAVGRAVVDDGDRQAGHAGQRRHAVAQRR